MEGFCGLPITTDIYNGVHIDLSALDTKGVSEQSDSQHEPINVEQFDVTLKSM